MTEDLVQVTLAIPTNLHEQVVVLARRHGTTVSAIYAEALNDYLDVHGPPTGGEQGPDER